MPSESGYYRFPTIHDDHVVFVSEDDLFSVSVAGGPARRLSANPGSASRPVLSPDGKLVAFTGRDEGQTEVWTMPATGGPATRLTYLGAMTYVAAWRGRSIVFASETAQPFMAYYHLHEVPASGGPTKPLNLGPAQSVAFEPRGKGVAIGRNTGDPARWKRYRGGTAGTLWVDRAGTGEFERLIDLTGYLAAPMWIGRRIWFLSDHEGVSNLYSVTPTGKGLTRHTDHADFYVRFPQTDGKRIVYSAGADIWVFDVSSGETRRIDIELGSARPQRNRKFVDAGRFLESYAPHPEGHSLAVVSRGKPFSFPLWEKAVVQHGEPDGVRYRHAKYLPDGKRIVAISDEGGEEELVILGPGGSRRRLRLDRDLGRATDLAVAPAGKLRVALSNHRYEVIVIEVGRKTVKVVDTSRHDRAQGLAWSPDGRWLAYALPETFSTCGIRLYDAETGKVHPVGRPDFRDMTPSFDPEGKHLYFISYRELNPVYDRHSFALGFPRGARLMVVPLAKDLASPFEPEPRPPAPPGSGGGKPNGKKEGPPKVKVDVAGIADRVLSFPVEEGVYGKIRGLEGKVLFTSYPIEGSLGGALGGSGAPPATATLMAYDFAEQKQDTVISGITGFEVSADAKVLFCRVGNRIRALPAGMKPEAGSEAKVPGRESGWVDLGRVKLSVDPAREWEQMFSEAWRLQRDQFWVPDMSGLDWRKVFRRYRPLLDRVACRSEFSDLMWEMQGELGTSHAYEMGGDYRPEPGYFLGFLGADLAYDAKARAYKIRGIPRGDSWSSASPLAAPGLGIKKGDLVLAIDDRKVDRAHPPGMHLVNRAGQWVTVTVAGRDGKRKRTVTVKTLPDERALRYREWVEANREMVHKKTGGRVGYVHIPNMGPQGFSEFHRYFLAELSHEGLVIDVRFNGGGHVSQLLLDRLIRRRVGYDTQRWGDPMPYPGETIAGPMVALTNERAGSDGDIFSHCFKLYGLGPLIGKRTWGGVIGIWPRHSLVDGSLTTQPEFSFWFEDVGFGVENYGTDPDIEVEIMPQDHAKGRDPQLATGIREAERLLAEKPVKLPDFSDRPKLGLPRLPKRKV